MSGLIFHICAVFGLWPTIHSSVAIAVLSHSKYLSKLFSLWSCDDTLSHFSVDSAPLVNFVSVTLLKQREMEENAASTRGRTEQFLTLTFHTDKTAVP